MNRSCYNVEIGDFVFIKERWLHKDRQSLHNHVNEDKDRPFLVIGYANDNPDVLLTVPLTHSLNLVLRDLKDAVEDEVTSSAAPFAFFCSTSNNRSGRVMDGALLMAKAIAVPRLEQYCELAYKSADLRLEPLEAPNGHKYPTKASMIYARELFAEIKERYSNYVLPRYTVPNSLNALCGHVSHASSMHFTKTNIPRLVKLAECELAKSQQKGLV